LVLLLSRNIRTLFGCFTFMVLSVSKRQEKTAEDKHSLSQRRLVRRCCEDEANSL